MHTTFLICEAPALKMLLLYKSLYLTYDLQKRVTKCKDILACGKMKGISGKMNGITAVTQGGGKKIRISNSACLVSLAQMERKQTKCWQNKYWFHQESERFVFRSSWNWVKNTLSWQSCFLHMRKAVRVFFTIYLCFWAQQSGPLGRLEKPHWVWVEWPCSGKVLEKIWSLPEDHDSELVLMPVVMTIICTHSQGESCRWNGSWFRDVFPPVLFNVRVSHFPHLWKKNVKQQRQRQRKGQLRHQCRSSGNPEESFWVGYAVWEEQNQRGR